MKKSLPIAAAVVLIVGCTPMFAANPGDPRPTTVDVVNGHVVVDQEPIIVNTRGASIIWRVPNFSSLQFPQNAVTFANAPEGEFNCTVSGNGKQVVCVDRNSKPARYKYTIRLQGFDPLDPSVVNN